MARPPLRQAFLVTVASAALAGPIAVGCSTVTVFEDSDNPDNCPSTEPSIDESCPEEGLSCSYGPRCGAKDLYLCSDGLWAAGLEPLKTTPAPECVCPDAIPSDGSLCRQEGLTCGYGDDSCGFPEQEASCQDGTWFVYYNSCNPPPPFYCPTEVPENGSPCWVEPYESPGVCTYSPPCGDVPTTATCSSDVGLWQVEVPLCPGEGCAGLDLQTCNAVPDCRWLEPGCAEPSQTQAPTGCFPAADCMPGGCTDGLECQTVVNDPCAHSSCNACGEEVAICLSPID
ncbi:MAG: hypothetical protein KC731_10635 [Myxococcales bacterium]|nr:hypothetical protein [Myxococcales bacterium]